MYITLDKPNLTFLIKKHATDSLICEGVYVIVKFVYSTHI